MKLDEKELAYSLYLRSIEASDRGNYGLAARHIKEAISLDEQPEYLLQRGMASFGRGDVKKGDIRWSVYNKMLDTIATKYPDFCPMWKGRKIEQTRRD